jgi:hypothetical protein
MEIETGAKVGIKEEEEEEEEEEEKEEEKEEEGPTHRLSRATREAVSRPLLTTEGECLSFPAASCTGVRPSSARESLSVEDVDCWRHHNRK